ncbi:rCG25377 [Rattus norvegicus]|uniref:RCG25377 n=1 Tax=Rattus norvegicus TaxID=10116 RepID=A6I3L9_RAT|nr:rCG25377 [Rattus norvegicus]
MGDGQRIWIGMKVSCDCLRLNCKKKSWTVSYMWVMNVEEEDQERAVCRNDFLVDIQRRKKE